MTCVVENAGLKAFTLPVNIHAYNKAASADKQGTISCNEKAESGRGNSSSDDGGGLLCNQNQTKDAGM